MHLFLKPEDDNVRKYYENHSTFHDGDAGLDLFCPEDVVIEPKSTHILDLKIQCEVYHNDKNISYYLYPRSSLSKTPLRLANSVGIIDAGYRSKLKGAFDNTSDQPYYIKAGQRLLQICAPDLGMISGNISLTLTNTLSETSRGEGGFGSTGQ